MKYLTVEQLQKLMAILEKHSNWYKQNGFYEEPLNKPVLCFRTNSPPDNKKD